jgi:hypothetical protein
MVKAGVVLTDLWMALVALQQTLSGRASRSGAGSEPAGPDQNVAPAFTM